MASPPRAFVIFLLIALAAVAAAGGAAAWSRYGRSEPIVLATAPAPQASGTVCISGAVVSPGIYPLRAGDTLDSLIGCAGGAALGADISRVDIFIPSAAGVEPQRVDINRAEGWLLQALPGIGEVRAQAIIEYRENNGGFRSTAELMKVKGIDSAIYERLKSLVTVAG